MCERGLFYPRPVQLDPATVSFFSSRRGWAGILLDAPFFFTLDAAGVKAGVQERPGKRVFRVFRVFNGCLEQSSTETCPVHSKRGPNLLGPPLRIREAIIPGDHIELNQLNGHHAG